MKNVPNAKTVETILEYVCRRATDAYDSVDFWTDAENDEGRNGTNYPSYHESRLHAEGELYALNLLKEDLVNLLEAIDTIKRF